MRGVQQKDYQLYIHVSFHTYINSFMFMPLDGTISLYLSISWGPFGEWYHDSNPILIILLLYSVFLGFYAII